MTKDLIVTIDRAEASSIVFKNKLISANSYQKFFQFHC